ncbi:hypothetical protein ABFA07_000531 [Porites harrisoni]
MSSLSDSSSCTSESDLESFTVDEVIGELSEFAPYDDSCANPLLPRKKPRTTTKEFIAKKKGNNSFNEDIRERCQRMNGVRARTALSALLQKRRSAFAAKRSIAAKRS